MDFDKETQGKIQELQLCEQNSQNLLMQKQAFQLELNETENALNEVIKSGDDVYKMVGQILIKSEKDSIKKELEQKSKLLKLRIESIEKQQEEYSKESERLRSEVMKKLK